MAGLYEYTRHSHILNINDYGIIKKCSGTTIPVQKRDHATAMPETDPRTNFQSAELRTQAVMHTVSYL